MDCNAVSCQVTGYPAAVREVSAAAAAVETAPDQSSDDDREAGVSVAAARRRPGAEEPRDAAGTATTAVQVAEYTARTVNPRRRRRRTARTRDPSAHHWDHPAVTQTTHTHTQTNRQPD